MNDLDTTAAGMKGMAGRPARCETEPGQLSVDPRLVTDEENGRAVFFGSAHRSLDRGLRRMIATHGIYRDRHARIP